MSFVPIRFSLPWLLGRAGASEEEGRQIVIRHGPEVIDGLLWCEATGVIEPNIRDICLFLLLKALSSTDSDGTNRRGALKYLIKTARLASRTSVPMAVLKLAAVMEQQKVRELEDQINSWRKNPYDTPRFVSTILHPAIVALLVPDTRDTAEWDDRIRGLISVLLRMFYQEQINDAEPAPDVLFDRLIERIDERLWGSGNSDRPSDYQTATALSIILRDPRMPPAANCSARLDLQEDAKPPGYIGDLLTTLYLHDLILPLSRRVIALYAGPVLTKKSELWALTLRIAGILRDPASYDQRTRNPVAEPWADELDAVVSVLRGLPDISDLLRENVADDSGANLREHLVWTFMTAVADDYILITMPQKEEVVDSTRGKQLR